MEQGRLKRLRQRMLSDHIEALFITNDVNRKYMTGFTGSAGAVLITMDKAMLITDFRYMGQAPEQAKYYTVVEQKGSIIDTVKTYLQQWDVSALAFEQDNVTYGTYVDIVKVLGPIELIATHGLIEELRMIKDAEELQVLQEACTLADEAFEYIINHIKPGVSERHIALELEFFMRNKGAVSSSFDTIVASGERSALPHGVASERILQNNEFVKLDFGAYYKGYCSDITRTVIVGKPSEKHKEIYDIVLEAQEFAVEHLKPGMTGREADALTRDIIRRYGYNDYFGHGTGHGIGMEIHESPRLSPMSDTILKPGMTVTIEPGIYIPQFGGVRIEDDVVVTDTGSQRLTQATKQLICID